MGSEPTVIIQAETGTQFWYINCKLHREDGPAAIWEGGIGEWYINGKHHRENGPAVIYPDGSQYWYNNGHDITDEITEWAKDRDIDLNNLTKMDKMIISLEWGNYGKRTNCDSERWNTNLEK